MNNRWLTYKHTLQIAS